MWILTSFFGSSLMFIWLNRLVWYVFCSHNATTKIKALTSGNMHSVKTWSHSHILASSHSHNVVKLKILKAILVPLIWLKVHICLYIRRFGFTSLRHSCKQNLQTSRVLQSDVNHHKTGKIIVINCKFNIFHSLN